MSILRGEDLLDGSSLGVWLEVMRFCQFSRIILGVSQIPVI